MQHLGKTFYSLLHAKGWLSLKAGLLASATGFGLQLAHAPNQAQAEYAAPSAARQTVTSAPFQQRLGTQLELVKAVVSETAARYAVPRRIALGLSGHESGGWKMWEIATGEVVHNQNPAMGDRQASTDWGVMQINDRAHPEAFPQARQDLRFNVDYGLRYLAQLHQVYRGSLNQGFGDWDVTLAAYHLGHPPDAAELPGALTYLAKIRTLMATQPAESPAQPKRQVVPTQPPLTVNVSFSSPAPNGDAKVGSTMPLGL